MIFRKFPAGITKSLRRISQKWDFCELMRYKRFAFIDFIAPLTSSATAAHPARRRRGKKKKIPCMICRGVEKHNVFYSLSGSRTPVRELARPASD